MKMRKLTSEQYEHVTGWLLFIAIVPYPMTLAIALMIGLSLPDPLHTKWYQEWFGPFYAYGLVPGLVIVIIGAFCSPLFVEKNHT